MWRHKAFVGLKLFACYFHPLFPEICYELDGLKLDNCRSQHSKCNSNFKIQRNEFSNFENLILKIIECVLLKIPWWHGISKFQAWKKIRIMEKIGGMEFLEEHTQWQCSSKISGHWFFVRDLNSTHIDCIARFFQIFKFRKNISKSKLSPFSAEIHFNDVTFIYKNFRHICNKRFVYKNFQHI